MFFEEGKRYMTKQWLSKSLTFRAFCNDPEEITVAL